MLLGLRCRILLVPLVGIALALPAGVTLAHDDDDWHSHSAHVDWTPERLSPSLSPGETILRTVYFRPSDSARRSRWR